MFYPTTLEERLDYIQGCIQKAAANAGRKPKQITLVAITKKFPVEIWEKAINVNLTTIGESRIQEAHKKAEKFLKRDKIELHLIGHLQSNKVRKAVDLFDVIQTVDSINLAKKIDSICKESRKKQNIYLQINTGEDPRKHGISTKNARSAAMEISKMENITLDGIMTIPPQNLSIKELRSIYCKTRKIRDEICTNINNKCKNISMGMSSDYETAIIEGSTHIRIGTALFGKRPQ